VSKTPNPRFDGTHRIEPRPAPELSRWALPDGKLMSLRCGRGRVGLGLGFGFGFGFAGICGLIGWRSCGSASLAGFLPGGLFTLPISSGYPPGNSPNPALQATGRIKPRPSPELRRSAREIAR
jgi:hypothetical protein